MALSDKALRAKYLYLITASALERIKERPSRQELEADVVSLESQVPTSNQPDDNLCSQTGLLLGRLANISYRIIHNFELRDHNERKSVRSS